MTNKTCTCVWCNKSFDYTPFTLRVNGLKELLAFCGHNHRMDWLGEYKKTQSNRTAAE